MDEMTKRVTRWDALRVTLVILVVAAALLALVFATIGPTPAVLRALLAATIAAPFIEYVIHRWVSHNLWMCRTPFTASVWQRIHYDHHQDPTDPRVLLGEPLQVMMGSVLFATPIGLVAGGFQGLTTAIAVAIFHAGVVELVHSNSHMQVLPAWRYFEYLKRLHLLHHFHNETVNFGVTSPFFDWLLGTYSAIPPARSASVRDLGYVREVAQRYPFLARISRHAAKVLPRAAQDS